jgi:hypothetical protein
MGTNYYEIIDCCDKCGRGSEDIHIGKSSAGWTFSLHIIPSVGLNSWKDWKRRLKSSVIKDEYGNVITLKELDALIKFKRKYKDEAHMIEAYKKYPKHYKQCKTGDSLCAGDFS